MNRKYYLVDAKVVPDIFAKVIQVKELLRTGRAKDISDATQYAGISRSSYYKYKDYIFTVAEGMTAHKVTLSMLLGHQPGVLSGILNTIAEKKGNILTINQDIPINNVANVTITFDMSDMEIEINELIDEMRNIQNVVSIDIIAME